MLRNSFVLADGIGPRREASLWRHGIRNWDDFLNERSPKGISDERKKEMDCEISLARDCLEDGNASYFARRLAPKYRWRCLKELGDSVCFLDIETTGLSIRSPITLVGMHDGRRMHTLIRGRDLTASNLKAMLSSVNLIVTYNGSSFDLPVIEHQFPGSVPEVPHVDLKHPLRRIGLTGGLKAIEREMGIERDSRVEYMTGQDAVYLWRLWERQGKRNALELLVEYNTEDCKNLKALAGFAYDSLKKSTFDAVIGALKN